MTKMNEETKNLNSEQETAEVKAHAEETEVKVEETSDVTNENVPEAAPAAEPEKEEKPAVPEKKPKKTNPHPYRWITKLGKLLVKVGILILIGCAMWIWVGNVFITHDNNMYPHIKDGDLVITYKLQGYIGDNVIVLYERGNDLKIGRIIARGGDVVEIGEDGLFTVNGLTPYENVFYKTYPAEKSDIEYPYTVPEGSYFVLNDMREMNKDSRVYGGVPEEAMRGKIVFICRHRGF